MEIAPQLWSIRRLAAAILAGTLLSSAAVVAVATGSSAAPTSIGGMRAQASAIASQVDTLQTKIEILSEEYDQAASRASALSRAERSAAGAFSADQSRVTSDSATLKSAAIAAYVDAGGTNSFAEAFSANASSLPVQQTYIAAASSSLDEAMATLHNSEITLSAQRVTLQRAAAHEQANAATLSNARSAAIGLERQLSARLANVKGSLETAVAQAEVRVRAQAQAAAAAEAAAASAAATAAGGPVGGTVTSIGATPTSSTGTSGSASSAIAAAKTQLGVPYAWAGANPGGGFDCSGLTMWAWGQAGVNLPHSAAAQYDSIEHISSSELQPGDLIFYAWGGYIYHVTMYVGGGDMIEAENTGTVVHIVPIRGGVYAYGRP